MGQDGCTIGSVPLRVFRLAVLISAAGAFAAAPPDSDFDGLSDSFEQNLLEKFIPSFRIDASDCDSLPAEFVSGSAVPHVVARNGTLYGQVFPLAGGRIELHYYHLWGRDCGRAGHALDAEHVSVLLDAASERALYWYAGAHEATLCDMSSAARASVLDAEDHGPEVWISSGKHASYFQKAQCELGCGGDRCGDAPLPVKQVLNLGEAGSPINGAMWVHSDQWNLAGKMTSDFPLAVVVSLENPSVFGVVNLRRGSAPAIAAIRGGNSGIDSLVDSEHRADQALETGSNEVDKSLGLAHDSVDRSIRKSYRSVKKFLRRSGR
jgi:hypothetical protein